MEEKKENKKKMKVFLEDEEGEKNLMIIIQII